MLIKSVKSPNPVHCTSTAPWLSPSFNFLESRDPRLGAHLQKGCLELGGAHRLRLCVADVRGIHQPLPLRVALAALATGGSAWRLRWRRELVVEDLAQRAPEGSITLVQGISVLLDANVSAYDRFQYEYVDKNLKRTIFCLLLSVS